MRSSAAASKLIPCDFLQSPGSLKDNGNLYGPWPICYPKAIRAFVVTPSGQTHVLQGPCTAMSASFEACSWQGVQLGASVSLVRTMDSRCCKLHLRFWFSAVLRNVAGCFGKRTGESCTLSCSAPSTPLGNATMTCQENGHFLQPNLECAMPHCGNLSAESMFSTVLHTCDGKQYGERCAASCPPGYESLGREKGEG